MSVGMPGCLTDSLSAVRKRRLTVNANDTTSLGERIGTLLSARVIDRVIADQRQIQSFPARLYVSQQTDVI